MLFNKRFRLGFAALAAAAATFIPSVYAADSDDVPGHVTFVNSDRALGFSIAIPEDNDDQFYFTLRVHRSHAWGAVGLGSADMPGAMYLFVYDDRDQISVTFSPRLAYGWYEPAYDPDFEYELLNGTGISGTEYQHMVVVGRCLRNCLSWASHGTAGGKLNINSQNETAIYALGPIEGFSSNKQDENLKFHVQYGSFVMNMTRAHGATEAHIISESEKSDGAYLDQQFIRKADIMSTLHAVAMVLAIVLLMPLGAVMMRIGGHLVKWHAYNQIIATILVFVGFGVGIAVSYRYQRSRSFTSYHQIIGFFVLFFVIAQLALGVLHHRKFQQTRQPTRYGGIHLWLGRVLLLVGIMNGFFGFTFALNRKYGIILAALILFMCFAIVAVVAGRRWLSHHQSRSSVHLRAAHASPYHRPPLRPSHPTGSWSSQVSSYHDMPSPPPPPYEATHQNIGLRQVATSVGRPEQQRQGLGSRQQSYGNSSPHAPRELV